MIPEIFKTPKKLFRLTEMKKLVGNNDEQQQELNNESKKVGPRQWTSENNEQKTS